MRMHDNVTNEIEGADMAQYTPEYQPTGEEVAVIKT